MAYLLFPSMDGETKQHFNVILVPDAATGSHFTNETHYILCSWLQLDHAVRLAASVG